jgi:hypothetical protein
LQIVWGGVGPSCGGTDYALYKGTLASLHGGVYDHSQIACTTAGATSYAAAMPPGSGLYFLATAMTGGEEGSYGRTSAAAERPAPPGACRPAANITSCP